MIESKDESIRLGWKEATPIGTVPSTYRYRMTHVWELRYEPIVITLTLASFWLLLSRQRSKPAATQPSPKQNTRDAI